MKKLVFLVSLTLIVSDIHSFNCNWTSIELEQVSQNPDSIQLISINSQSLGELIINSPDDFHLIILFTEWCKPCLESIPVIDSAIKRFDNIQPYYIYPDSEKNLKFLVKYLEKQSIIKKTYYLDNSYTGNVKKRFINFRNQICSDCEEYVGFPTVILLDKRMKMHLIKTGNLQSLANDFLLIIGD